jgi:hypothetical protein
MKYNQERNKIREIENQPDPFFNVAIHRVPAYQGRSPVFCIIPDRSFIHKITIPFVSQTITFPSNFSIQSIKIQV